MTSFDGCWQGRMQSWVLVVGARIKGRAEAVGGRQMGMKGEVEIGREKG